ncbi:Glutaminase-like protein [Pleurostoma richardsiae]|uniref:Glutaminase-like protein n=1 Tax=Pleurostoma richardsiae TaxID=41990 RepID=A0AA38SBK8_9PEZI|nr:Glutaminase-like protein [Pleurostoma richardsiae]
MRPYWLAAALATLANPVAQAGTFTPARPPAIPLAVKSPYLNTWLQGESGGNLPGFWPQFWTGQVTGWQGFVSVDNAVYNWMGAASGPSPVNQTAFEYTATRSIFTFDVEGKVAMTVTFLSPVYPDDLVQQSLQFSYANVEVRAIDGGTHNVQVYMDITGEEFASGDASKIIDWDFGIADSVAFHRITLTDQTLFSESSEQANWGTWFLSTAEEDGVTWKSGADTIVRAQFQKDKTLDNTKDTDFRAVNDNWPVFAFSKDLGFVSEDEEEVLFSIGLTQDTIVNFEGEGGGATATTAVWKSAYETGVDAMVAFYKTFSVASSYAERLDNQIQDDSVAAAGEDYATITTLAVRQTFGGLAVATGPNQDYIFLKEISSNSDIQTVDVIFPAFPILLYLNATWGKLLLDPLYENQENGKYPNKWAMHDLGTFPNAVGYPGGNDEPMPLEECANMIIMTLAYVQRGGSKSYLSEHWDLLRQWALFLVEESLVPADQLSTDDFAGTLANQTNLALKGIIALKAMAAIANMTGRPDDDGFGTRADSYLASWRDLGINGAADPPHATLSYGDPDSHGLLYNLYADQLLGLGLVGEDVYAMQSDFYPTVARRYGVPLDTRHTWAKSDWAMFAAAAAGAETRDMLVSRLRLWLGAGATDRAMTDLFDAETGGYPEGGPVFAARPVMGGVFALLALPE